MTTDQFLFVTNVPRSGSTMMGLILSAHPDICICPETLVVDNLLRYYGKQMNIPLSGTKLQNVKSMIIQDEKLNGWKIDIESYLETVRHYKSITPKKMIEDLLSFYRDTISPGANIIGIKKGSLLYYWETIFATWPGAKFVYTYRDARASVTSSVKKLKEGRTIQSETFKWRNRMKLAESITKKYPDQITLVRYEAFVQNPAFHCESLTTFVGVSFTDEMLQYHINNQQLQQVPEGFETRHRHTNKPVSDQYINTWQSTAPEEDIQYIEALIGHELEAWNYTLIYSPTHNYIARWFDSLKTFVVNLWR